MSFLFHFLSTTYFAHCLKNQLSDDQMHVACSVEEQEGIVRMCSCLTVQEMKKLAECLSNCLEFSIF